MTKNNNLIFLEEIPLCMPYVGQRIEKGAAPQFGEGSTSRKRRAKPALQGRLAIVAL